MGKISTSFGKGAIRLGKRVQTVFKRREKKYLVSESQYHALLATLQQHMQPDEYGRYTILNIYFDTEHDELIRRSVEKPVFKEKLRARSYGVPDADSRVFLEMKRKFKGEVYKRRVTLRYRELQAYIATGERPAGQAQVFAELDYFLRFYHPVPKLFLAYDREALRGTQDLGLRITFDRNIRSRTEALHLSDGDFGTRLLPEDMCVMEVKCDGAMPLWLCNALTEAALYPVSFSKYGKVFTKSLVDPKGA